MSGYQIFNEHGALVIDSNYFGTYYKDVTDLRTGTITGPYSISTLLGNDSDMSEVQLDTKSNNDEHLKWYKFGNGAKVMMPTETMSIATRNNAGRMARTISSMPLQSGYKDIYNQNGQLVWSAISAASIPRIIGFFDIPANYDLDNQVYSQYIGTDTWLLASSCPGLFNVGDSEAPNSTSISAPFFRFVNGTLSVCWYTRVALTWAQTLKPYGLRIPYAILPSLN